MTERVPRPKPSGISRRAVLAGLAAAPLLSSEGRAATGDRPPVFSGGRRQFTLLEPAVLLPKASLSDIKGQSVPVAPVPGRVLLVNIWAMWCSLCRTELPMLDRFHQTMKDRVDVVAICTDRIVARNDLASYLGDLTVKSLPIYLDPQGTLAGDPASPLPVIGMPLTYLITPSGHIAGYIAGVADWMSRDGQALLAHYMKS